MLFTDRTSADGVTEQSFVLGIAAQDAAGLDGSAAKAVPGVLWTPDGATGPRPVILLGHGGRQHKRAPGIVARARRFAEAGYAAVSIDAPNHGDRPKSEEFTRLITANRARIAEGEDPIPLFDAMHTLLTGQAAENWTTVLTAIQQLDDIGTGPVGYWGVSMGCGLGVPFVAGEPRVRAAVLGLFASLTLTGQAARITVPVEFLMQWDDAMVPRAGCLALFEALGSAEKTLHANSGGHQDIPRFEIDSALRFFARHLR